MAFRFISQCLPLLRFSARAVFLAAGMLYAWQCASANLFYAAAMRTYDVTLARQLMVQSSQAFPMDRTLRTAAKDFDTFNEHLAKLIGAD